MERGRGRICLKGPTARASAQTAPPVMAAILPTVLLLAGCAQQPDALQAELFPETQQPHFKTCAARLGGTYKERELQRHLVIDIYKEPAPDEGPITDECITRE